MIAPRPQPKEIAALTATPATPAADAGAPAQRMPPPGPLMRAGRRTAIGIRASQPEDRDPYSVTALADITDRSLHAAMARFTVGISPAALAEAYLDWATHLAYAPGKRAQLIGKAIRKAARFANYASHYAIEGGQTECCIEPLPQDRRFAEEGWRQWPFSFI